MHRLLIALCLLASPAWAEVARVTGGEHADFTRLVIQSPGLGNWRFGRVTEGYELQAAAAVTGYDLSRAFDRIPRSRVSGLWRVPASGRLHLALACDCHAIAFEFRPGMVVVDVRPGPAPAGSGFEMPLDPQTSPRAPAAPRMAEYDWLAARLEETGAPDQGPPTLDPATAGALRDALLRELSEGVAEGIVRPAERPPEAPAAEDRPVAGLRITLGDLPGMIAATPGTPPAPVTAEGATCLPDTALNLGSWLAPGPPAASLGLVRHDLLAEFDAPVTANILRSAKAQIALGFGAEARQTLALMEAAIPEVAVLRTFSYLVDLDPPPENAFARMESCDSAAALWAGLALALSGAPAPERINDKAITRAFAALPPHLRTHLGPVLVDFALSRGKTEAARRLRDAILRAPVDAPAETALTEARYQLGTGEAEEAARTARKAMEAGGTTAAEAAVTLAEAAFRGNRKVPATLPADLAAYLGEARGTAREAPLRRALVLALAMTGDAEGAFTAAKDSPADLPDLWQILAATADPGVLMRHAIPEDFPGVTAADTALIVARRLLDLGFPDQALRWIAPLTDAPDPAPQLLTAEARLALRDARGTVLALSGATDPAADLLRARAYLQLGDAAAAAAAFGRAGDEAGRQDALRIAGLWDGLDLPPGDPWQAAVKLARDGTPAAPRAPDAPMLAHATAQADQAAQAVSAVTILLDSLPPLSP
ncbi:hypothetical protein [Neotabrizicola sp. VNH66]|uniref:hypothetical protein n=1 Tax=Neotabrizicola sp. VNH66 TaxID=3400918 RepID=UPI003BFA92CA